MSTDALVLNLLVLAVTGATSVVVGLVFRRLGDIAKDVSAIGERVGEHAERLAEGKAKIEALEERSRELDTELKKLVREGCARGRECLRTGT